MWLTGGHLPPQERVEFGWRERASLTLTTMYASTWEMAERICRDDREPVASFGEFVFDYGDLGIYNTVFCGGFSKHWYTKS
jgi:hypothetical protein